MSSHKKEPPAEHPISELDKKMSRLNGILTSMSLERLGNFNDDLEADLTKLLTMIERMQDLLGMEARQKQGYLQLNSELKQSIRQLENERDRSDKGREEAEKAKVSLEVKIENLIMAGKRKEESNASAMRSLEIELAKTKKAYQTALGTIRRKEDQIRETNDSISKSINSKGVSHRNELKLHRVAPSRLEEPRVEPRAILEQNARAREKEEENDEKKMLLAYQATIEQFAKKLTEVSRLPVLQPTEISWYDPNYSKLPANRARDQLNLFAANFRKFIDTIVERLEQPRIVQPDLAMSQGMPTGESYAINKPLIDLQNSFMDKLIRRTLPDQPIDFQTFNLERMKEAARHSPEPAQVAADYTKKFEDVLSDCSHYWDQKKRMIAEYNEEFRRFHQASMDPNMGRAERTEESVSWLGKLPAYDKMQAE